MRNTILKNISKQIVFNDQIVVLLGDLGVFQMKEAIKNYPSRVINFGIMEQTMIGFASGLSKGGFYPITYSITPFLVDRAFEQIKIDLIYNKNNVLILSAGGSYDYSNLGPTHHCPHDVSNLLSINHPCIVHPFTNNQAQEITDHLIDNKVQAYFRISSSECHIEQFECKKVASINFKNSLIKSNLYEKYKSIYKIEGTLSILFGPDSKYLNNFKKIINQSEEIITVPFITNNIIEQLSNEITNFDKVFLFIPYEPSVLILKLIKSINKLKNQPQKIIALHPKNLFFDNAYKKEYIFKNFTEESIIN